MLALLLAALQAPACPATPAPLPASLTGWSVAPPIAAGRGAEAAAAVPIGRSVRATLTPQSAVRFAVAPARPGAADARGGVFAVTVVKAGRYRVALGTAAWIDVVAGGRSLASVAHGHGPACSGIRKMVDFDLSPGRHLIQIAGSADPAVTLLVTPLP
ncbi:hypothetical protein [Sphingomonas sp. VNH70]|uniref:hypothetical protein n=1 Tax=Sphingomonas silueang TaxID=3156617 RepID=UPI0032B4FA8F